MCFVPPRPRVAAPVPAPRIQDTARAGDAERRRRLRAGAARTRLTGPRGVLTAAPSAVRRLLGE